jgi:hypothetical protein
VNQVDYRNGDRIGSMSDRVAMSDEMRDRKRYNVSKIGSSRTRLSKTGLSEAGLSEAGLSKVKYCSEEGYQS